MATALENADYLADELGWGRVRVPDMTRGRITQYFSQDQPDHKGGSGYGFIAPIDDNNQPIQDAPPVWFLVSKGYFVRSAPSGTGLNWTYRHFVADRSFDEPAVGNIVVFEQRPSRRRVDGFEAGCWTYESEYARAASELTSAT